MENLVRLYPQKKDALLKVHGGKPERIKGKITKRKFPSIKQIVDFLNEYYLLKMNNKIFRWFIEVAGGLGMFIFLLASGTETPIIAMIVVGIAFSLVPAVMVITLLLDVIFVILYFICRKYIRVFKRFYPQKQRVKQQWERSA